MKYWAKARNELWQDPRTLELCDAFALDEDTCVGKLLRLWIWAQKNADDGGRLTGSPRAVDRVVGIGGFGEAMSKVGGGKPLERWLEIGDGWIVFPRWQKYNSRTALDRAEDAARKQRGREQGSGNREQIRVGDAGSALLAPASAKGPGSVPANGGTDVRKKPDEGPDRKGTESGPKPGHGADGCPASESESEREPDPERESDAPHSSTSNSRISPSPDLMLSASDKRQGNGHVNGKADKAKTTFEKKTPEPVELDEAEKARKVLAVKAWLLKTRWNPGVLLIDPHDHKSISQIPGIDVAACDLVLARMENARRRSDITNPGGYFRAAIERELGLDGGVGGVGGVGVGGKGSNEPRASASGAGVQR